MPVDAVSMGARIAGARGRAGLTQAQLADAVRMDRSALAKIETGSRRVSALELARIADELHERIEWFVTDPPPSIVSYRNRQDPGTISSDTDRMAERIARNVEFVMAHDERWQHPEPAQLARPESVVGAERTATEARALLGLESGTPLLDVAERMATLGLLAFSVDLGPNGADAASILLPRGGIALINGHLHAGRRRLALVHELGHYLFADDYTVDWRVAAEQDGASWESRLDRFARAVLLPDTALFREWAQLLERGDDVRTAAVRLGSEFCVDMSTLARRLVELGVVDQATAGAVRTARTTRADIVELDLVVRDELTPTSLPRRYVEAVLRLYRADVVSVDRALDLLLDAWDESDLPPLPKLPESAIWKFVT